MTMRDRIIDYIRNNRVSTTEVADALGKSGVLTGVRPVTNDHYVVGPVRCIFAAHGSNYDVHHQIRNLERGEVALVLTHECGDAAVLGDLVAKYSLLYKGASALVVDGYVRDAARLRREHYPIWATGLTPLGCVNVPAEAFPAKLAEEMRAQYEGGIAICDDGGVVVIPPFALDEEMLDRLDRIELQEDIWYFCLNTLKWDTKQIVTEKIYLEQSNLLPEQYRQQLSRIRDGFSKREN